jgi:hypothetical protein
MIVPHPDMSAKPTPPVWQYLLAARRGAASALDPRH